MTTRFFATLAAALAVGSATGTNDTVAVRNFRHAGAFPLPAPVMIDTVDVNSHSYSVKSILDSPLNFDAALAGATEFTGEILPGSDKTPAIHLLAFDFTNRGYTEPTISIEGIADYKAFIDGAPMTPGAQKLKPATHKVVIKYLSSPGAADTAKVSVIAPAGAIELSVSDKMYTLDHVLHGRRIYSTEISPDGKYLITIYSTGRPGGATDWEWVVTAFDGKPVARSAESLAWMPEGSRYYRTAATPQGRAIIATDAATGAQTVVAKGLPDGYFTIAPDERYLVFNVTAKGPQENPDVYRILEPEDRQPGWRNRNSLALYDIATGFMRPLTFGHHNANLLDISDDGSKLLVRSSRSRLTKRPTTVFTIAVLNLADMSLDTIVADDGFIGGAIFSPDASKILLSGTPESLGGIGRNVPEGRIPSMIDTQLFLFDTASRKFTPLTRDFNPNVGAFQWSRADGKVYFTAENRDEISLFRLNTTDGKIEQLPAGQDIVKNISLPLAGVNAAFASQGMANPDRLYTLNTKTLRTNLLDEPLAADLADVKLGKVAPWNFLNSRGDSIYGRFYLPPHFDPTKKYPLIVNYYGGCSPTSRNFESRYPHHAYAAQGYVVYVVEPSGATGFGQEFSSRHVNTAGEGVAQDIIEGTRRFCEEHPYVDSAKIGCIGASYGGFMTQYLQTVTDMFAAAISHAGISDHTSYWGEGYWGYSYSEVSMAESYPWSHPDLYVKQSPLFRADKIHTPLLFLHGDADNNVPVGESIQMFTALKLLDRPTAFVAVKDQDHHIMDYDKRIRWQDTIFAWFAKYLKDQPEWWDSMYPEVSL
ncbi:MAG: prolyl oligopeptidase family serine peptidase [Paramuribaculum sp.]|nr:prolyl oligopeptidase family serine peptidase [Paramuribaculum sp.]